jgi:hypothetical protein
MRYVPYDELDGIPHVVVDGSARPDTLLTLSHWPGSPTPPALRADLSAQIGFRYLDHPELAVPAEAVSNNHFDQDGLASVFTLVDPDGARLRRAAVVDLARAGDFSCFEARDSARASFAVAALGAAVDGDPYAQLLPRVPELIDHPERFRALWADEDAHLAESEAAIADGTVTVEELPDLDLAVVTVPEGWSERQVHRFATVTATALHPMAVHNATGCFRILTRRGRAYELRLRYETWVQYESRRPLPRPDLGPFAAELNALEHGGGTWSFDGAGAISPALHLEHAEESSIAPEPLVDLVVDALCRAEPGWDPYA